MTTTLSHLDPPVLYSVSPDMYHGLLHAIGDRPFPHRYEREALTFPHTIDGVSPERYKQLLEALGDYRLRHVYLNGVVEMVSPRKDHDRVKKLIGRLIEHMAIECNINIQSIGSTTLTSEAYNKGVEPDEAYYVANEPSVRGKDLYDPANDPPPDLVLEVDVTSNSRKRMQGFAALGIPEVWQHDGEQMHFFELCDGAYQPIERSRAFPRVTPGGIEQIVDLRLEVSENNLVRKFLKWVREQPDE
jgi:Uma2 family endonuclease